MSLKGKTLFITGASRGIGREIALRAARDGAKFVIAAKSAEPHPKLPGTIFGARASPSNMHERRRSWRMPRTSFWTALAAALPGGC